MLCDYFLYSSCLPPDSDVSSVGGIVKQARANNGPAGITGVLGFDGENFIQYVEGPRAAIQTLRAALARDDRHVNFTVLSEGADVAERAFSDWQLGYADVGDESVNLSELHAMTGDAALDYFMRHTSAMDFA